MNKLFSENKTDLVCNGVEPAQFITASKWYLMSIYVQFGEVLLEI